MQFRSRVKTTFLLSLFATWICLFSSYGLANRPLALESAAPERSLLVIGGSFSPPTFMHLALMADTLYEHDFSMGTFLVANPYKVGAAPAEIPLELTCIAVESFDFVLRNRNIPFRNFKVLGPGRVSWVSKAGRVVKLEVSNFDIDNKISDSIHSIRHFKEIAGGSSNIWWLSGGDSGASMPTWGPWWREMFENTNMIFIGRKSSKGEPSIDHTKKNPLSGLYPEDFLSGYKYELNEEVHKYRKPGAPIIVVLSKNTLPFSSTAVRNSLATSDQEQAQFMLTPQVYQSIIINGYYSSARRFLTRQNLEAYLIDEFRRTQARSTNTDHSAEFSQNDQYLKLLQNLVADLKLHPNTSSVRENIVTTTDNTEPSLMELIATNDSNSKRLSATLTDLRNQLLLGDPRYLVSRLRLQNGFAINPNAAIYFNLVKSQMRYDVPLALRQVADKKNHWFDLNISTNELRAILGQAPLAQELETSSQGLDGAFANSLFTAIQMDPLAKQRFELFSTRRYFLRLALGKVRVEFTSTLSKEESAFETWAQSQLIPLSQSLTSRQIELLSEMLGEAYLISRFAALQPEVLKSDVFWTEFLNLAIAGYPGEKLKINQVSTQKKLALRLYALSQSLQFIFTQESRFNIPKFNVTYEGQVLAEVSIGAVQFKSQLASYQGRVFNTFDAQGIFNSGVLSGLKNYYASLAKNLAAQDSYPFKLISSNQKNTYGFLPTSSVRSSPDQNFIQEIHFFFNDISRQLEDIRLTFQNITSPASSLVKARALELERIKTLRLELEQLEIGWLKRKKSFPFEKIDSALPGYQSALEQYQDLQQRFSHSLDECRALNHVALGVVQNLITAEKMTPSSQETQINSRELLWREILGDTIDKYIVSNPNGPLGNRRGTALEQLLHIPFVKLETMKLEEILLALVGAMNQQDTSENARKAHSVFLWLNQKYGLINEVMLRPMLEKSEGSYRSDPNVRYSKKNAELHPLFDPKAPSSLQDLDSYIHRKWGGLKNITQPERVVFSELGTYDTLQALKSRGFTEFFQVNSSYAMRGSKTLLAFQPGRADPLVVFYSFISEDLLQHKLMQLSLDFGSDFKKVQMLSSNSLKSWDQAQQVVADAIAKLPPIQIDDLVLGYGETIAKELSKNSQAQLIQTWPLGNFAEVSLFKVQGERGLSRTVLVITKIEYRYFGKSVLPLIRPFLDKRIDRVIFAGSAGVLTNIPQHSLIVPRNFSILDDSGHIGAKSSTTNDLYDLAPFGVVYSGRHISVPSPLIESQALVRYLHEQSILSVDVEGSQIARLIENSNAENKTSVRFASAYIATDVPQTGDATTAVNFGLHQPDFIGKNKSKESYAVLLNLLWDLPNPLGSSAHTSIITQYYAKKIEELTKSQDRKKMQELWADINQRLIETKLLTSRGGRVSRGLVKSYGDILAAIRRTGFDPAQSQPTEDHFYPNNKLEATYGQSKISTQIERAIIIQSMTRSSTLNSGDVVYNRGKDFSFEDTRELALNGASQAIDWLFSKRNQDLTENDVLELHKIITNGVLAQKHQGQFANFEYSSEDGRKTSSKTLIADFFSWLRQAPLTYETAIEAYAKYEALHPHKDGSGRIAECIAQHILLRAHLVPLLFPNRFDIDYILSLRRNGGSQNSNRIFAKDLIHASKEFASTLHVLLKPHSLIRLDSQTGLLIIETDGEKPIYVKPIYTAKKFLPMERENHSFVSGIKIPKQYPIAHIQRQQYDVYYIFASNLRFLVSSLNVSAPNLERCSSLFN